MLFLLLFVSGPRATSESELDGVTRAAPQKWGEDGLGEGKQAGKGSWGCGPSGAFFPSLPKGIYLFSF